MREESFLFLKSLVETASPSGFEQAVQKRVREYAGAFADEVRTDVNGNVTAIKNPGAKLRVMLAGHCDEIGLMVTNITKEGFIYFAAIGGIDPATVVGQRVTIHGARGPIAGVIGRKPIHLMEKDDIGKVQKLHEMWIDIGAKDEDAAKELVAVGDPVTTDVGLVQLQDDLVAARAFDDRVGAFVVMEALRLLADRKMDVSLYAVSTVQENVVVRGVRPDELVDVIAISTPSSVGCQEHSRSVPGTLSSSSSEIASSTANDKSSRRSNGKSSPAQTPAVVARASARYELAAGIRR